MHSNLCMHGLETTFIDSLTYRRHGNHIPNLDRVRVNACLVSKEGPYRVHSQQRARRQRGSESYVSNPCRDMGYTGMWAETN